MERKEAIQYISVLMGGTLIGAGNLLSGCSQPDKQLFTEADVALLDEIADTILPATKTPGAKDAGVGAFIALMVNDCYDEEEQTIFKEGLKIIDKRAEDKSGSSFIKLDAAQRHDLLVVIDKEQKTYSRQKKENDPPHYFRMMKELTLLGYFTSKPGATQAKRYMPLPGKYIGCVPYTKGEKAII